MAETNLTLAMITPQRSLLETPAQWVELPAASGAMRVLPGHAPTLGLLGAGLVRYRTPAGEEKLAVVQGGFLEVSGDRVSLLADRAELPQQIDAAQARADWERLRNAPADAAADAATARAQLEARQFAEARAAAAQ